jgi:plasmid stabilization system protein ParE
MHQSAAQLEEQLEDQLERPLVAMPAGRREKHFRSSVSLFADGKIVLRRRELEARCRSG